MRNMGYKKKKEREIKIISLRVRRYYKHVLLQVHGDSERFPFCTDRCHKHFIWFCAIKLYFFLCVTYSKPFLFIPKLSYLFFKLNILWEKSLGYLERASPTYIEKGTFIWVFCQFQKKTTSNINKNLFCDFFLSFIH